MRLPCNTATREEGQILVMGVLLLTSLMGMLGLIIDGGSFFQQRRHAQSAADSAALAAAGALKDGASASTAMAAAREYAASNGFNNDGSSNTVTVNIPPTSGDHVGSSSYAEVFISEKPRTHFIQVVLQAGTVGGRGVAGFAAGAPCAMCVLSPHAHQALSLSNNGNLTVVNGGVVVNSDQSDAAMLTNNASITATSIGIVGGTQGSNNYHLTPAPALGISPVPDPLAAIPVPSVAGPNKGSITVTNANSSAGSPMIINPGVYTSLTVNNDGYLTLTSGIYVVTGTINANNNGHITGNGVMVYFACSSYPTPCNSGQAGGRLSLSNNATYALVAPASGPYQGLAIFYDRNNTAPVTLENNAGDNLTGTLYAKSARLDLSNNAGVGQLNSLVVVGTATLSNNGNITLNLNLSQNVPLTTATALVE